MFDAGYSNLLLIDDAIDVKYVDPKNKKRKKTRFL